MDKQSATDFFAWFYRGEHHIPGKIKEWGEGWCVIHDRGDLATTDYNDLTRLVLMAHRRSIRVSIMAHHFKSLRICIWQRKPGTDMVKEHPSIEQSMESFNAYNKENEYFNSKKLVNG